MCRVGAGHAPPYLCEHRDPWTPRPMPWATEGEACLAPTSTVGRFRHDIVGSYRYKTMPRTGKWVRGMSVGKAWSGRGLGARAHGAAAGWVVCDGESAAR